MHKTELILDRENRVPTRTGVAYAAATRTQIPR